MNDKDLIAQNLEEKKDIADAVPSPATKRTTRKKTASQDNSDTEKKEENTTKKKKRSVKKKTEETDSDSDKETSDESIHADEISENQEISTPKDITDAETEPEEKNDNDIDKSNESENEDVVFLPIFSISSADFNSEGINDENANDSSSINEETSDIDFILPPDEIFAVSEISDDQKNDSEETESLLEEEGESDFDEINDDGQYKLLDIEPEKNEQKEQTKEEATQKQYDPQKPRRIDRWFDFIELIAFTLLAVMIVTSFFFRHSIVDGESMENTLHSGEHLIISDLFYTPKRGDIIVCEDYTTAIPKPIVKRVIAIEGDTVKITSSGEIFVNDILREESEYVHIDELNYHYNELEITVPKGELFVMGDHRNKSTDSREIGTVSEDSVLGKVLLRFYPFNKFGKVD